MPGQKLERRAHVSLCSQLHRHIHRHFIARKARTRNSGFPYTAIRATNGIASNQSLLVRQALHRTRYRTNCTGQSVRYKAHLLSRFVPCTFLFHSMISVKLQSSIIALFIIFLPRFSASPPLTTPSQVHTVTIDWLRRAHSLYISFPEQREVDNNREIDGKE